MNISTYCLFDGTSIDLAGITFVGPIRWHEDKASAGLLGEFSVYEGGDERRLSFGVSAVVGAFRFMDAVRKCREQNPEQCPAKGAYASLRLEARRLLAMHHGDLVSAWETRHSMMLRAA
jgi:hypothetical protein